MVLKKYRDSRIVHINTNIILAAVLATLIAAYPVHLTRLLTDSKILTALLSFAIDGTIDFIVFSTLHLVLNKKHINGLKPSKSILRDIKKIQSQRVFLSILYFIFGAGLHYYLLMIGVDRVPAFLGAYISALIVVRIVHTYYGKKTGLFDSLEAR